MDLVFLHGPPASGKYTIAKEIEGQIDCSLFHNHLTIDVAKSIFDFGTAEFWKLVQELRLACFREAAGANEGLLLYTSCYDHPSDLGFFEEVEEIFTSKNYRVLPVFLNCSEAELARRVTSEARNKMGKIRSHEGLQRALDNWNCIAIPRDSCISVKTDARSPSDCAGEIIEKLRLGR